MNGHVVDEGCDPQYVRGPISRKQLQRLGYDDALIGNGAVRPAVYTSFSKFKGVLKMYFDADISKTVSGI